MSEADEMYEEFDEDELEGREARCPECGEYPSSGQCGCNEVNS